jgi:hypothetical protein
MEGDIIHMCVMPNGEVNFDIFRSEKDRITHSLGADFCQTYLKPALYPGKVPLTLCTNEKVPGTESEWVTKLTWRTIVHELPENMGKPRSAPRSAWSYIKNLQLFFNEHNIRTMIVAGNTSVEIAEESECPCVWIEVEVKYCAKTNECWVAGETATIHADFKVGFNNYGFQRKHTCWYNQRCSVTTMTQLCAALDGIGCLKVTKRWF